MNSDDQQDEREQRILQRIEKLRSADYSYEDLLRHAAEGWDWAAFMEEAYEQQQEVLSMQDQALEMSSSIESAIRKVVGDLGAGLDLSIETIQKTRLRLPSLVERETVKRKSESAKAAVEARHNKPGGSREMSDELLAMWMSGLYESRKLEAAPVFVPVLTGNFRLLRLHRFSYQS